MSGGGRFRSGLAEFIAALAATRTAADIAGVLWWWRNEACGASSAGLVLADPDARVVSAAAAGGPDLVLDPLLLAEFAAATEARFFASGEEVIGTYPVLATVGATVCGGACAVIPLTGPGTPPGALVLGWNRPRWIGGGDRGLLVALAGLCAAELARTLPMDRQRDAVERLRHRLRPAWLPRIAGAEVAVRHEPAGGTDLGVGFYDVFAAEEGVWRLVAGDVSGRGTDMAVLASLALQTFRAPDQPGGPATALGRLDRLVREFGQESGRMSAVCVDLTRRGRGFTLTAARAGHPAPLVLRQTGAVQVVDVLGSPLGHGPDPEPAESGVELNPGDALLLTAGRAGNEMIGDPRIAAVLSGCAGWSPDLVLDHLGLMLAEHPRPVGDGTSLLAMRVRGGRPRPAQPDQRPAELDLRPG